MSSPSVSSCNLKLLKHTLVVVMGPALGLARAQHLEGLLEVGFCMFDLSIGMGQASGSGSAWAWAQHRLGSRLELRIWRLDPSLFSSQIIYQHISINHSHFILIGSLL